MRRLLVILCLMWSCVALRPPVCAQQGTRWLDHSAAVNWNSPLNRGLASWWLVLPEGPRGGVYWRDLCGRNHGTLTNMDPPTDWVGAAGRPGGFGALDFDGSNDRVSMPNTLDLSSGPVTLACYARPSADGSFIMVSNASTYYVRMMRYNSYLYTSSNGDADGTGFSVLATNNWWHLVAVFESASSTNAPAAYVNGVAVSVDAGHGIGPNTPDGNIHIGARSGPGFFLTGNIDDVRIWNRALSAAEVWALYQGSRQGYTQTLAWRGGSFRAPDAGPPPSSNGNFLPLLSTLAPERTWEGVDHDPRHSPFAILGAIAP